jgi:hypothetical protein
MPVPGVSPAAVVPAPAPGAPPTAAVGPGGTAPLPGGVLSAPPAAIPAPSIAGTVAPAAVPVASEESGVLAEPEQPFFSVMLLDGQPIEFPVEMTGSEQDLGHGPVILQPNGRGVETTTHKYIAFDSGEKALYDLVSDPDGQNNIAIDPAQSALMQELSAKLANFPTAVPSPNPVEQTAPAPMEAIPVPPTPDIPKVAVPAPISVTPVEPQPTTDTPPVPLPTNKPVGILPPPLPKPSEIKLPEPGLPPGVGDSDGGEEFVSAILPPPKPSATVPAEIELPKPGLPKPSEVPELKTPGKPIIPPPLPKPTEKASEEGKKPPLPPLPKNPEKGQESTELKKDLLEAFDTDGDGKISEEEKPTEEQLQKFTARRREKPIVDPLDNKRKSRIEAESAVKTAMRELEEARMREEMAEREELEAHKNTFEKSQRGREQCDEEISKLKQTDQSRHEKAEATIAKLKQEFEHKEELIRHGVRNKKAARLEDEDRIRDLDNDLANLHEEDEEKQRKAEEEDHRIAEERRVAKELYLERVRAGEEEKEARLEDKARQEEGEESLKQELQGEEVQLQEKLRGIKFEEDDEHSRVEHTVEVLERNREKFISQENIEDQEIRDLTAKAEARRMAITNEKKVERRMAVAEHEANLINLARAEEKPGEEIAIDLKQSSAADVESPSPPEIESKAGKPVLPTPELIPVEVKALSPTLPALPIPVIAEGKAAKPNLPPLPASVKRKSGDEDVVLPAIIEPGSKSSLPVIVGDDEKPAFPVAEFSVPANELVLEEKQEKKGKLFGKLFGDKNKDQPESVVPGLPPLPEPKTGGFEPDLPPLPKPVTEGPEPNLPPLPIAGLAPAKTAADIPALPPLPSAKAELPPLPRGQEKDSTGELERKTLERKLERIADDRAERMNESVAIEPSVLSLPKPKVAGDLPPLPSKARGPKPEVSVPPKPAVLPTPRVSSEGLPPLPSAGGDKTALPPLPKPGVGPSLPKPTGLAGGLPPLASVGGDKTALPQLPKLGAAPSLPKSDGLAGGLPPLPSAGGAKIALPQLPKPGAAPSLPKPDGLAGGLPPLPSAGGDELGLPPLPKPGDTPGGLPPLPGKDK